MPDIRPAVVHVQNNDVDDSVVGRRDLAGISDADVVERLQYRAVFVVVR